MLLPGESDDHRFLSGAWKATNLQDESVPNTLGKCGICPHFPEIVIVAGLLGTTKAELLDDEVFCGRWARGVNNIAPLAGRSGTEYTPQMFCRRLVEAFGPVLALADMAVGDPEAARLRNDATGSLDLLRKRHEDQLSASQVTLRNWADWIQGLLRVHEGAVFLELWLKAWEEIGRGESSEEVCAAIKTQLDQFKKVVEGCDLAPERSFFGIQS